jgi:hypothetical protein
MATVLVDARSTRQIVRLAPESGREVADGSHRGDFLSGELHAEFFLETDEELDLSEAIPLRDVLRGRRARDDKLIVIEDLAKDGLDPAVSVVQA